MAETARTAESRFTARASSTKAATSKVRAKTSAALGVMAPVTNGRALVRFISLSMSRSTTMLMALAPPAASAPPARVATISQSEGRPRLATTMVGKVVTSSSSMMRGLVRAT